MKPISLLYHDVVDRDRSASGFPGADADTYKLDAANFTAHLDRIADCGASRVQLVNPGVLSGDPASPLFLTFDDGGANAHALIAALLEARGWRGHFFVVTNLIDRPGFLKRQEVRELHRRGHHIGSHSHTHPLQFSKLRHEEMLWEWRESRRILTEITGESPFSVSVPGGFYSAEVAHAAREAGYRVLFNSEPSCRVQHEGELVVLGRYGVKRDTTPGTVQTLARGDAWARATQVLLWNLKKPLKKAGGPVWLSFRRWFFERHQQANTL